MNNFTRITVGAFLLTMVGGAWYESGPLTAGALFVWLLMMFALAAAGETTKGSVDILIDLEKAHRELYHLRLVVLERSIAAFSAHMAGVDAEHLKRAETELKDAIEQLQDAVKEAMTTLSDAKKET